MKKSRIFLLSVFVCITLVIIYFFYNFKNHTSSIVSHTPTILKKSTLEKQNKKESVIFVPYWSITTRPLQIEKFDKAVYFGLSATTDGINTSDNGYIDIKQFVEQTKAKTTILTLSLVNQDVNDQLLGNKILQQEIINQCIDIAKKNNFSGVLLDFEFNALRFDSVLQHVNDFYQLFSEKIKKENLSFYVAMYGDLFFRARPYDIKKINTLSDGIMIMAYNFHKPNGNPGPNFPLQSSSIDEYDFKKMIDDYTQIVPSEKMIVVFGLYGYDWKVADNGDSLSQGIAITDLAIESKFFPTCLYAQCTIKNDSLSSETNILYIDGNQEKHSLWFENMDSISQKMLYLKSKNIMSTALWAYGYL